MSDITPEKGKVRTAVSRYFKGHRVRGSIEKVYLLVLHIKQLQHLKTFILFKIPRCVQQRALCILVDFSCEKQMCPTYRITCT